MVHQLVTIQAEKGLHMRPAGVLARAMSNYQAEVLLLYKDKQVNAKSLLNILGAGIRQGCQIEIQCDGIDEQEAMQTALDVIEHQL